MPSSARKGKGKAYFTPVDIKSKENNNDNNFIQPMKKKPKRYVLEDIDDFVQPMKIESNFTSDKAMFHSAPNNCTFNISELLTLIVLATELYHIHTLFSPIIPIFVLFDLQACVIS